jgi:hypothetical protein
MENLFLNQKTNESFNRWLNGYPLSDHDFDRQRRYELYLNLIKNDEFITEKTIKESLQRMNIDISEANLVAEKILNEYNLIVDFINLTELSEIIKNHVQ